MADDAIPVRLGQALRTAAWVSVPFICLLLAGERALDRQFLQAVGCLILFPISVLVIVKWSIIGQLLRRHRTMLVYWIIIILAAIVLGFCLSKITSGQVSPIAIQSGRVTWNFDQPGETFFLAMGNANNQGVRIAGFQAHGKNNSPDPISAFSGMMRSDFTNAERPIYILAQEANAALRPPIGPQFMFPTLPEDTFGIPPLTDFDIQTHPANFYDWSKDGEPVADFLRNFGAFTIILKYDGTTIERHFTIEQVKAQLALFEKQTNPQATSTPRVTRKPTAPPAAMLPFMIAPPEQPPPPPAKEHP
jgi:hypothetical protein